MRVVGVGASAGGLEALEQFFAHMPADSGWAFVVVQHLAPDFKSLMDELLRRHTSMPIHVAGNGQALAPNTLFLIPPRADMIVSAGHLMLSERDTSKGLNLPIDLFFRSLATEFGSRAVGIVLSGTGSDGSRGVVAIHEAGGTVLCQSPESASFDGMPNSAIATGAVHAVLAPAAMPEFLLNHPIAPAGTTRLARGPGDDEGEPELYAPVFRLLSDHHGVDFQRYKLTTIARRIERRLRLRGCRGVDDYVRTLNVEPGEITALYHDLLIGVTEFFRDPEVWDRLAHDVLPGLLEDVPPDQEVRVWVAAAATGEEAYTVAILLHEAASQLGRNPLVRIFATDLHKASIEFAGQGIYPEAAMHALGPERLQRYFIRREDGAYQVSTELRKMVVFAQHNLLADPPFTKLDLVSCRNLLIYLQPSAQRRALSLFHFGLRRGGGLVLGSSESLGDLEGEFDTLDRRHKIYAKRRDGRLPVALRETRLAAEADGHRAALLTPLTRLSSATVQHQLLRAYDTLLETYVPPAFLVDPNGTLLHTFGRAAELLRPPVGRNTSELGALIAPELRMALTTGLQRAQREATPVNFGGLRVPMPDGAERMVRLQVRALSRQRRDEPLLVLVEDEAGPVAPAGDADGASEADTPAAREHVQYLEAELRYAREHLQATVEELETTNEELQATNEELMASNEELQSANEELHSVNEELYTVNKEYEEKIEELTQLTDDMENLLQSTQIGTIFLDAQLRVRKFTPAAARQFNLLAQDVGRPIAHLSRNIDFDEFDHVLQQVLSTRQPSQHEVRHHDGGWFLLRLHPYRSEGGAPTGVVLTFVDIHVLKVIGASLMRRNADLQSFAYAVSHDLQEPVRMIVSFGELLEKRHAERSPAADPQADAFLHEIRSAARRLRGMLDAILQYSRVDSRGGPMTRVRLDAALAQARLTHEPALERLGARLEAGELPVVWGDENQLAWLLHELIDNALKFRGAEPPHLSIAARPVGDQRWLVEVADNGTGVPGDRTETIFEMFRRLVPRDGPAGLGAGLAIARRIVERHGGEIHAQPRTGGGLLVGFTLHGGAHDGAGPPTAA